MKQFKLFAVISILSLASGCMAQRSAATQPVSVDRVIDQIRTLEDENTELHRQVSVLQEQDASLVNENASLRAQLALATTRPTKTLEAMTKDELIQLAETKRVKVAKSWTKAKIIATLSQSETYIVQTGDTLYGIAKKVYGNGNDWKKISDANPDLSTENLVAGKEIVIP